MRRIKHAAAAALLITSISATAVVVTAGAGHARDTGWDYRTCQGCR